MDAYRGAGRPEAAYVIERTIDRVAVELGLDPADVRRRNFVRADQMPYQQPVGAKLDSGRYAEALDRALAHAGYEDMRRAQAKARAEGRRIGIGLAAYTHTCGMGFADRLAQNGFDRGGFESAVVRVHADGHATVLSGSHSHGQGHATSFAQIAAEESGHSTCRSRPNAYRPRSVRRRRPMAGTAHLERFDRARPSPSSFRDRHLPMGFESPSTLGRAPGTEPSKACRMRAMKAFPDVSTPYGSFGPRRRADHANAMPARHDASGLSLHDAEHGSPTTSTRVDRMENQGRNFADLLEPG